ncbi:MAG: hypothetical protein AAGI10_12355 [Pseudomonadota bacterium]
MILLAAMTLAALALGALLPVRWGVFGFLAGAALLFAVQAGINVASGFEGTSIEESLLLFGGSFASYAGFKVLVTYRAFVLPMLALASVVIFRMSRSKA